MSNRTRIIAVVTLVGLLIAGILLIGGARESEPPAASESSGTESLATLRVRVVTVDEDGIAAAAVSVGELEQLTAADGYAVFESPPGDYVVTVGAIDGYLHTGIAAPSQNVHLTAGGSAEVQLVLRRAGVIRGRILRDGAGVVADIEPRSVVSGVYGETVTSAADGTFSVTVDPGRVRLHVVADGARARSREVRVRDGEEVDGVEIELRTVGSLSGTLRGPDGPIAGSVEVVEAVADAKVIVGADGKFQIGELAEGPVRLRGSADGFEDELVDIEIVAGTPTTVDIVLQPGFGISGTIAAPPGAEFKGAWAFLMSGDAADAEVHTKTGPYRIDVEPPAGSSVQAVSPFFGSSDSVAATPGKRVDLTLKPGGYVAGNVVTGDGAPVSGFEVGVESFEVDGLAPYGSRAFGTQKFVSTDGSFEFGPLRPGKYWLRAAAAGHAPGAAGPIVVGASRTTGGQRIVLSTGGVVRGRVVDAKQKPLSRVQITVFDPFSGFAAAKARTNADGTFELRGVAPGRRSIRAAARGFLTQVASGLDVPDRGEVVRDIVLQRAKKGERFSFHGIGAVLQAGDRGVSIVEAMDGKPAAVFGLRAGDTILAVDGQPTKDMRLGSVVELIRGEQGVAVELELDREGEGRLTVEVERGRVVVK